MRPAATAILALAIGMVQGPRASGQRLEQPQAQMAPMPAATPGVVPRHPSARRPRAKVRASRQAAAQEAAALGTAVGQGCQGKAAMQRNERQWVVLCSNGRSFLVELPSPRAPVAPATECSLGAKGPHPACFAW